MKQIIPIFLAWACASGSGLLPLAAAVPGQEVVIVSPAHASVMESLAAREIRRYVYLRSGQLFPIVEAQDHLPQAALAVVVAQKDRPIVSAVCSGSSALSENQAQALARLQAQEYLLQTRQIQGRGVVLVAGGDAQGVLYGAYRLAEHLGVRFYLHGDVVPDGRLTISRPASLTQKGAERLQGVVTPPLALPPFWEVGKPLFALRGIQPFHDFPEGPDWWNRDDYLAVLSQLPKLRMNFFGLHTYPENRPNAEPTVWIGTPDDMAADGQVKFSYPASLMNTLRGNWGYRAEKTGDYGFGAAQLFERDAFGAEVMGEHLPQPKTPEANNEVFNRTAAVLREAFTHARRLGVQTCVGTETPLVVPKLVKERLQEQGKAATNLAVIQELYEGIFRRAAVAYPLDYYWFWTPENWTWESVKPAEITAATNDLMAALAAYQKVRPPFKLATCGWVLGPQQDRAMFDKLLPKEVAVSCINREVGKTPVEKGFADVKGRGKWAIPWLEDDPALTSMQLWAGRMRRDAFDALRYGCDGLMGIHWRTRVLGPAVSALAQAAWEQGDWTRAAREQAAPPRSVGPVGGKYANFPTNRIADTEDAPLYQTVRYDVSAYYLQVPNGFCTVTLKFCEPNYKEAGKRVFDVKLQGVLVITNLDIFAKVGQNRALDYTFENIAVTNGWLDIDFVHRVEYPSIAALVVEGPGFSKKINCGGPAYQDYAADWPERAKPESKFPPTDDFYLDWAQAHFGKEVAAQAASIFARIDGKLPRPSDWIEGPGGIRPDQRPWSKVSPEYQFADQFAALAKQVTGAGSRERFAWWLDTFRYMKAMGELNCKWGEYASAAGKVKAEKDPARQKELARQSLLALRREIIALLGNVYDHLLATVSNPGELGTVMNWEQHCQYDLLKKPGEELAKWLGEPLSLDVQPPKSYHGPTRVIVPTVRTSVAPGEEVCLRVLVLSERPPTEAALYWRKMGPGKFSRVPLTHIARGVYSAKFGGVADDLEYYVKVSGDKGEPVYFPATAPKMNQTLVLMPAR